MTEWLTGLKQYAPPSSISGAYKFQNAGQYIQIKVLWLFSLINL